MRRRGGLAYLLAGTVAAVAWLAILSTAGLPVPAAATPPAITEDQAVEILDRLPEIRAWSAYIARQSHGKVHASFIAMPEEPVTLDNGQRYWSIGFFEDHPGYVHRWDTFMVRLDGKQIRVMDDLTDDLLTLKQWRTKKKPMDRIR